ncbi:MAG: TolC family protein [Planctomycetota bacterium]|jgi:outer membrane protein TolC
MNRTGLIVIIIGLVFSVALTGCASSENYPTPQPERSDNFQAQDRQLNSTTDRATPAASKPTLPELNESSTLSDYLAYAALNNPGLEAAFNRWKASVEGIVQSETLPEPRLTYQYYIEEVETRVGPQRQSIGIAQTFPWFGKLQLKGNVAQEAANAQRQRYESEKLKLFHEVKDAYAEYYYLAQAVRIFQDNVTLVRHLEEVARTRFKASAASHPDVIKAQVELGKLEDHLKSLQEFRTPLQASLNASLNRPTDTEIPWPRQLPSEGLTVSDKMVLDQLIKSNPDLRVIDFEVLKNKQRIELASKEYYPDITLGLNYIDTDDSSMSPSPKDNGKDPLIAMVSVNLPLWREKYDAGVRQARAEYYAARRSRDDKINDLTSTLKMVLYKFHDAERKINLYQDALIPKAQQSLKVTESDYQAGKSNFLDLIDSQRVLLEFELSLKRALADHAQNLAKIEMLAGDHITSQKNKE